MIPRPHYVLPAECVVFEQGSSPSLPLANAVITSGWFDVYQVHKGGVIVPQTGAIVSSGSETIRGVGTTVRPGAYYLDIYTEHDNAGHDPYTLIIDTAIVDALDVATGTTLFTDILVQPADIQSGERRPMTRRIPITSRLFRVRVIYAVTDATRFSLSAVLRAF